MEDKKMEKSVVKEYLKVAGKFIVKDVVIDVAAFAIVGAVSAGFGLYNKKKGGSEEA